MPARAAGKVLEPARVFLFAAACLLCAAAAARDFEIGYHERIAMPRAGAAPQVSFVAHGRQFDLELASNVSILALPATAGNSGVTLYRGRVSGIPGSWVRLSESDDGLSGVIWDGTELWLIDSHANVAEYFSTPESPADDTTVMFPLSEVSGEVGDIVARSIEADISEALAVTQAQPVKSVATGAKSDSTVAALSVAELPGRVLDIGLVASNDFRQRHGPTSQAALLEIFNVVEGIYLTQVGVQLRAVEVSVLETDLAILRGTSASQLLENFGAYKLQTPALRSLGLAHLFVGRDLDDSNPPIRTVGIANIGVLCDSRFAVGITEALNAGVFEALIAAHEIGHNFGAPHDAEPGGACAAEPDHFIMSPRINGGTRFSQCSIEQMQPEIAAATCMRDIPPADLHLSVVTPPPANLIESERLEFDVLLSNLSSTRVAGLELTATATGLTTPTLDTFIGSDGYCDDRTNLQCVWPWFEAGESVTLSLSASGERPGSGRIGVAVNSLNELDTSDNSLSFEVEILPLYDLTSRLSPDSLVMRPGETAHFSAAVSNYGAEPARDVTVHIDIGGGRLELLSIALPDCGAQHDLRSFECPIGELGVSATRSFGITVRAPGASDLQSADRDGRETISVYATSLATPLEAARSADAEVTIGEQVADLAVTVAGPSQVDPGASATWRIDVVNFGPDTAESVRVGNADTPGRLPDGTHNVAITSGECRLNAEIFECALPKLDAGESVTVELTATTEASGTYRVAASVESAATDSDTSNDASSLQVAVGSFATAQPTADADARLEGDDKSGSGSLGLLVLIELCALVALRRRLARFSRS